MMVEKSFYRSGDVVQAARDLLGKVLFTYIEGEVTAGIIVETEAYRGVTDRASHAFPGKKTNRNRIMFDEGGKAYVYLIYGIYYLFNIVTNSEDCPDAVLVRALEPVKGSDVMMDRRKKTSTHRITSGPGILSQAMGIDLRLYGADLTGEKVWLEYPKDNFKRSKIVQTKRIGVDYAGEDALLPWRFYLANNLWISKK
jgi:DNA-3-methyladenine glycosylase